MEGYWVVISLFANVNPIDTQDLIKRLGLGDMGIVQKTVDNCVAEFCRPYCPHDTGALEESPFSHELGHGEVVYDVPYAARCYYGTDIHFQTTWNLLAGAYWFERMKADRLQDILAEAKASVGK